MANPDIELIEVSDGNKKKNTAQEAIIVASVSIIYSLRFFLKLMKVLYIFCDKIIGMAKKKKRHVRKTILYLTCLVLSILVVCLIVFLLNFNFHFVNKKSIHEDALTYKTKTCLAFYPNSQTGEKKAKEICDRAKENSIFDYALIPYGDYYLVSYFDGTKYYVDHNYNDLVISTISEDGKKILSDYLRYQMKKDEIDEAYTYDFLIDTYYENIDLSDVTYSVENVNLVCHFPKYNFDVKIPLKYMQEACGINLGYTSESYVKPRYVSKNRKMLCFTFDDGPQWQLVSSKQIVDTLYKLDSASTFFIVGQNLGEKQINFCKESVKKGMEYGSHTQSHANLQKLSTSEAIDQIMIPYHDLCDNEYGFGYQMKTYRPPYGAYNKAVSSSLDLTAILWNVDSLDWSFRTKYSASEAVDIIYNKVIEDSDENDIVLFHDIYQTSADASCRLMEYYIKQGYQLVTVSELMEALDITSPVFSGK